jgi:hypothetical protein
MTHRRRNSSVALVGLIVLFLGLRLLFLRADPPLAFPDGAQDYALFADPAAKKPRSRCSSWPDHCSDGKEC